ncbi:hypothetical protein Q005_05512 [Pseudomonas aeruginosa X24509]|nr:hypothetical protein Q005_05512 [Pseudomonas aeruginosa X24509]
MINIPGQLAIRTINGRNGEFNVGKLSTSIGEFVIKDALLDQHIEGKYRGDFAITEIRPSYYTTGGRLVVEIRAKLDSMTLDDVDNLSDEEAERLSGNEVDPLDEVPAIQQPTAAPDVWRTGQAQGEACRHHHHHQLKRSHALGDQGFALGTAQQAINLARMALARQRIA